MRLFRTNRAARTTVPFLATAVALALVVAASGCSGEGEDEDGGEGLEDAVRETMIEIRSADLERMVSAERDELANALEHRLGELEAALERADPSAEEVPATAWREQLADLRERVAALDDAVDRDALERRKDLVDAVRDLTNAMGEAGLVRL